MQNIHECVTISIRYTVLYTYKLFSYLLLNYFFIKIIKFCNINFTLSKFFLTKYTDVKKNLFTFFNMHLKLEF